MAAQASLLQSDFTERCYNSVVADKNDRKTVKTSKKYVPSFHFSRIYKKIRVSPYLRRKLLKLPKFPTFFFPNNCQKSS